MDASARDDAMPRCRARYEIVEHGARAPLRATCATLVEGARALPVRDACERDERRECNEIETARPTATDDTTRDDATD